MAEIWLRPTTSPFDRVIWYVDLVLARSTPCWIGLLLPERQVRVVALLRRERNVLVSALDLARGPSHHDVHAVGDRCVGRRVDGVERVQHHAVHAEELAHRHRGGALRERGPVGGEVDGLDRPHAQELAVVERAGRIDEGDVVLAHAELTEQLGGRAGRRRDGDDLAVALDLDRPCPLEHDVQAVGDLGAGTGREAVGRRRAHTVLAEEAADGAGVGAHTDAVPVDGEVDHGRLRAEPREQDARQRDRDDEGTGEDQGVTPPAADPPVGGLGAELGPGEGLGRRRRCGRRRGFAGRRLAEHRGRGDAPALDRLALDRFALDRVDPERRRGRRRGGARLGHRLGDELVGREELLELRQEVDVGDGQPRAGVVGARTRRRRAGGRAGPHGSRPDVALGPGRAGRDQAVRLEQVLELGEIGQLEDGQPGAAVGGRGSRRGRANRVRQGQSEAVGRQPGPSGRGPPRGVPMLGDGVRPPCAPSR